MEPVTVSVLAYKAVGLVGIGLCLCVGFWAGKKLTNQLDYLIYINTNKDHKRICESKILPESQLIGN